MVVDAELPTAGNVAIGLDVTEAIKDGKDVVVLQDARLLVYAGGRGDIVFCAVVFCAGGLKNFLSHGVRSCLL